MIIMMMMMMMMMMRATRISNFNSLMQIVHIYKTLLLDPTITENRQNNR